MEQAWSKMLRANLLRPPESYVYFIADEGFTAVKIGRAKAPRARLAELQIGSPVRLNLMATFAGGRNEESMLHECFADWRTEGEWFSLAPELVCLIALLAPWRVPGVHDDPGLDPVRARFRSFIARRVRPDGLDAAGRYIARM